MSKDELARALVEEALAQGRLARAVRVSRETKLIWQQHLGDGISIWGCDGCGASFALVDWAMKSFRHCPFCAQKVIVMDERERGGEYRE